MQKRVKIFKFKYKWVPMKWIDDFDLFLFDFDGLLVNTEELHYLAYKRVCEQWGYTLDWDFNQYCKFAHYHSDGLRNGIYAEFPTLQEKEPDWKVIYKEKQKILYDLMNEGIVHLMPGVEMLLKQLALSKKKRCVVTHSPDILVSTVRKQNPLLDSIPVWITREHYTRPKPDPECYLKAIDLLGSDNDRIIGFEDTPRGLSALLQTRAQPMLICLAQYPEIPDFVKQGALHYPSFDAIP